MWAYSTTSPKWPVILGSQEITDHNCLSDEPSPCHCLLIIAFGVKTLVLLQCWVGARVCSVSVLVRAANVLMLRGQTAAALAAAHAVSNACCLMGKPSHWLSLSNQMGCFYVPYIYKMHLLCRLLQNLGCLRTQLPLLHLLLFSLFIYFIYVFFSVGNSETA